MKAQELEKIILREFYQKDKHLGIFLFGSSAQNTRHQDSDIDLIIFTKKSSNYIHYIDNRDGYIFDVFEMPIEYGFYLLHKRDPMWLHSFSTSKIITGGEPLKTIQKTSSNIIAAEKTTPSKDKLNQLLFIALNKYKKLVRYKNDPIKFHFLFIYCIESITEYLHTKNEIKPQFEPGINKLNRLAYQFGHISKLIEESIKNENQESKMEFLEKIINELLIKSEPITFPVKIQNIDVKYAINFFISSLSN